jgi:hypothetical protein
MTRLLKDVELKFGIVEESATCGGKLQVGVLLKDRVTRVEENERYISIVSTEIE